MPKGVSGGTEQLSGDGCLGVVGSEMVRERGVLGLGEARDGGRGPGGVEGP